MHYNEEEEEFLACVGELLKDSNVLKMDDIRQHANDVSCLDHCIFVSFISFRICKLLRLDYVAAARAGLLHDLYLCDWSTTSVSRLKRLYIHPEMALKNAEVYGLSPLEKDIILKHMWPINLRKIPLHRESVVVNLADKMCASAEMLRIYKFLYLRSRLLAMNMKKLIPKIN